MSRDIFCAVMSGAHQFVDEAEEAWKKAVDEHGKSQEVGFPETAFHLPMIQALTGREVQTLGDMEPVLEHCDELLGPVPDDELWLPYLGDGLDSGAATLFAQEILAALDHLDGWEPEDGYYGFLSDTIMRQIGIQLVDGRMSGFAAILGPAPSNEIAVDVVQGFQKRNILTFTVANKDGRTLKDQLE